MKEAPATCQILSQLRPSREQEGKGPALLEEHSRRARQTVRRMLTGVNIIKEFFFKKEVHYCEHSGYFRLVPEQIIHDGVKGMLG
jgi:hypothetical protein